MQQFEMQVFKENQTTETEKEKLQDKINDLL